MHFDNATAVCYEDKPVLAADPWIPQSRAFDYGKRAYFFLKKLT